MHTIHTLSNTLVPAYVDPGSGTLALQILIAGVISGTYACRTRAVALLAKLRRKHS